MRLTLSLVLLLAALALAGCASLAPRPPLPDTGALSAGEGTPLDAAIGPAEAARPGQSGFRLVREGPEAFAIRAATAVAAGRSLDVQTYIWHDDLTGGFLAVKLLEAADRGVRVRLLVDDMDARGKNFGYAALHAHPNVQVRMFNPFASRSGTLSLVLEGFGSAKRVNRRMHNKTWIADNRIAVAGGRNLGDEYFGASEAVNFVDLDFAMVGPVVREASASFDRYWNSPAAYPMDVLDRDAVSEAALADLRVRIAARLPDVERSQYASELRGNEAVQRLLAGDWPMQWTAGYRFVADDPAKVVGQGGGIGGSEVLEALQPVMGGAQHNLTLISPYFVPGESGTAGLVGIDRRGSTVRVLTNSLAANDVAMVYGGYSESRAALLEGGVEIWELKPTPGAPTASSLFGSSGASLHTKALTVDGRIGFVGSYNLDPRSTSLNCEQGILVDSPPIAAQLEEIFRHDSGPAQAWSVTLVDGRTQWSDGTTVHDSAPDASAGRKFQAWLAKVLPVESQL
jgi:putative cardiolipin synthase